jgi:hypothetical protein
VNTIADYRLPIADWSIIIADFRLPIADWSIIIADFRLPIADWSIADDHFLSIAVAND